jgi:polyisoprenoid-binding protein YceI
MTENVNSTWTIDLNHSEVQFKVKHLAVSNVAGIFKIFKGEVLCKAEDFDNAKLVVKLTPTVSTPTRRSVITTLDRLSFLTQKNFRISCLRVYYKRKPIITSLREN